MEVTLFRPVMERVQREEVTMLLAMGTAVLLEGIAFLLFGEKQRGVPPLVTGVYKIGDAYLPAGRALVLGLAAALIVCLLLFITYTRPGRALRALAQDREATALQGVNLGRISAFGFGLGAGLAGLAGGLLVTVFAIYSGAGTSISIKAFLMIMIGGAGVVSGAILGGFVLGFAESIGYALVPGSMTYLIIFIAVILFLIVRPHGIMGRPWG
jgi:branched-chain amino acid transport system permease protein